MIKIDFSEPTDDPWKKWVEKCRDKTAWHIAEVAKGENPNISNLYKDKVLKDILFDIEGPFHGKCAYCEALVVADQHGDVEHFRPKNRVTDNNNKPITVVDGTGQETKHPGYYWLAYDWHNLLPSCVLCNQLNTQTVNGKQVLFGKWDKFPVKNHHAINPGDEVNEQELLINPLNEDPKNHLSIDETGIFSAITPEGQTCIDLFGLNDRPGIVDERIKTFRDVTDKIKMLLIDLNGGKVEEVSRRIQELLTIREGKKSYSAAARVAISDMESKIRT